MLKWRNITNDRRGNTIDYVNSSESSFTPENLRAREGDQNGSYSIKDMFVFLFLHAYFEVKFQGKIFEQLFYFETKTGQEKILYIPYDVRNFVAQVLLLISARVTLQRVVSTPPRSISQGTGSV